MTTAGLGLIGVLGRVETVTMWRLVFVAAVAGFGKASNEDLDYNFPNDRQPFGSDDRIVGGHEADIVDHPYQVSFIVNNKFFCGGFIVSENYILTAAHCAQEFGPMRIPSCPGIFAARSLPGRSLEWGQVIYYYAVDKQYVNEGFSVVDPKTVVLRAGSSFRKNGTVIPITEVIPHPGYDKPAFDKDVAVMKTEQPIEFTETIQPIALPRLGRLMRGGTDVVVSGWGRTEQGASSIPERLMVVQIPVVYRPKCQLVYASVLTNNMWCGGNFFLGGQGTCQGDSGGAAIQDGMAVGIVSFGRGCGQRLSPSVFADISAPVIREFIKLHTNL